MKTIKITVEAKFGSSFQEEFGVGSLKAMMDAWSRYVQSSHKKNKINIQISEIE